MHSRRGDIPLTQSLSRNISWEPNEIPLPLFNALNQHQMNRMHGVTQLTLIWTSVKTGIVLLSGVSTKLNLMGTYADADTSTPPVASTITRHMNVQLSQSQSIDPSQRHIISPSLSYRISSFGSFQLSSTILLSHQYLVAMSSMFSSFISYCP